MTSSFTMMEISGREVKLSNPDKVFFPATGITKLDLVHYYLSVGDAVVRGVHLRPTTLKRYPDGEAGKMFFQHRVPEKRPEWLQTVTVSYPDAGAATLLCPADLAHVVWAVNLGCLDLNPWASRRWDLEHPDELRFDLDPNPGVTFAEVKEVAAVVHEVLDQFGLIGFPKTSGSRGIHVYVRVVAKWGFADLYRAGVILAEEVQRRRPDLVSLEFVKADRGRRVLIDVNQNARNRTVASAYSVRANPEALVSCPFRWDELPDIELGDFTIATVPDRVAAIGDLHADLDDNPCSLAAVLG